MQTWLLIVIVGLTWLFFHVRRKYSFWSDRGVPTARAIFPMGHMHLRLLDSPTKVEMDLINKHGKVQGTYLGLTPRLLIADPELARPILVSDFPVFVNRFPATFAHPLWKENLFGLVDEKWKKIRSIVSPTFTSGKLRSMNAMMGKCIEKLDEYLLKVTKEERKKVINTKEVISGLTVDVIATTTFATETNANNPDDRANIFVRRAMQMFQFNIPRLFCLLLAPKFINKLLKIGHAFNVESFNFFEKLSRQILEERRAEKGSETRKDLVQLMLNASIDDGDENKGYEQLTATMDEKAEEMENKSRQGKGRKLTDNELVAQCILFFLAGFETTASTLTFIVYELAHNLDVQERLAKELRAALEGTDINSDEFYDRVLAGIPYLDATIKETLRKYPPVARLQRICSQEGYKLGDLSLPKGLMVEISAYAIHHDPDNYADPERWDPERFMPENKHLLKPFTYLPFGEGPRNCVGLRFAYQEMKLSLAYILCRYRFTPAPNTEYPLRFRRGLGLFTPYSSDVCVERA